MVTIHEKILDAAVLDLTDAFAGLAEDEAAGVIKIGNLQDDPEKNRNSITIHVGDADAPGSWDDNTHARGDNALDRYAYQAEAFEVGGGSLWWRRFSVKYSFFFTRSKEDQRLAAVLASTTRARIEKAISLSGRIPGLTDDNGETAIKIVVVTSGDVEGGGPPAAYIHRGKVRWQVQTGRNY